MHYNHQTRRKSRRSGRSYRPRKYSGGGITQLPLNASITNTPSFFKNWNTYYVAGHGALLPRRFIVPPNTYILHSRASGYTCSGIFPVEEVIKMDDNGFDEARFFGFIKNPKSVLPRIYNSPKQPYKSDDEFTQIYEPGDVIFDLLLEFHNPWRDPSEYARTGPPFFGFMGIFPVPIPAKLDTEKIKVDEQLYKRVRIDPTREHIEPFLIEQENIFFRQPGNNVGAFIDENGGEHTTKLSNLITSPLLGASEPDKPRFIIVRACRGLQGLNQELGLHQGILEKVRRQSYSLRNRKRMNTELNVTHVEAKALNTSALAAGGGEDAAVALNISAPLPSTDLSYYNLTQDQRDTIDATLTDIDFKLYLEDIGINPSLVLYDTYGVIHKYVTSYYAIRDRYLNVPQLIKNVNSIIKRIQLMSVAANPQNRVDTDTLFQDLNTATYEILDVYKDMVRPYINLPADIDELVLLVYTFPFRKSFEAWLETQSLVSRSTPPIGPVRNWTTFLTLSSAGKLRTVQYFFKCGNMLEIYNATVIAIMYRVVKEKMPEALDCKPKTLPKGSKAAKMEAFAKALAGKSNS